VCVQVEIRFRTADARDALMVGNPSGVTVTVEVPRSPLAGQRWRSLQRVVQRGDLPRTALLRQDQGEAGAVPPGERTVWSVQYKWTRTRATSGRSSRAPSTVKWFVLPA
jgi:hypothetical protein